MRRRDFITLLGGTAAAWPIAVQAQQPALPLIGYLSGRSPDESSAIVVAFRQGLKEGGFVEGQNVAIESRFAEGNFDRLPVLAADLVRRQVKVLVTAGGTVTVVKAKPVVPATIPLLFVMGGDPVALGVVASLNRPGENITGVSFLVNQLATKSIGLLHELVPTATVIGCLVNPKDPNAQPDAKEAQVAADVLGLKLVVGRASTEAEIDLAFEGFAQQQVGALFVDTEPFFTDQRAKIVALAARQRLPAIYQLRDFVAAGGLATYGTSITEANRQLGIYTGQVLKGVKPADLPVMQSTKFELIINLKAARSLGLQVPDKLLALADEVIE
jgi:putative tryptophan/tyrosine transport system substrate-binding protein